LAKERKIARTLHPKIEKIENLKILSVSLLLAFRAVSIGAWNTVGQSDAFLQNVAQFHIG
jgi:hypothetical protein